MRTQDAYMLLQMLMDGVNPITGEVLPEDHVCQEPDVLSALHKALEALHGTNSVPRDPMINSNGRLNAGRPWTQGDLNQLRQLYEGGASMEEMCRLLQRRQRGIEKTLINLGLVDSKVKRSGTGSGCPRAGTAWTALDDKMLHEMWEQGKDKGTIAQALGRSEFAIECRMERIGMLKQEEYPLLPPWSLEDVKRLKEMHARGCTVEEIARAFNHPIASVRARMFYMGLTKEAPFHL